MAVIAGGCQAQGWGFNEAFGSVGDGTNVDRNLPVAIGSAAWRTVDAGAFHSCGIKVDGTTWCWGRNSAYELGDGTTTHRWSPTAVAGDSDGFTMVSAGGSHTCAVGDDATIWCWGEDLDGQLGDGSAGNVHSTTPELALGDGWVSVTAGGAHTCALRSDDTLWCWGDNFFGAVGDGTHTSRSSPTQVAGTWTAVSAGASHTCATKPDGTGWCWGFNGSGQIGVGDDLPVGFNTTTPLQVPGEWAEIRAGSSHTCGFRTDGSLWCWGRNDHGQLGIGTFTPYETELTQVPGDDWAVIAPGGDRTCALRTDDTAWCWGNNVRGGVGDGTNIDRASPTAVATTERWLDISVGSAVVAIRHPGPPGAS